MKSLRHLSLFIALAMLPLLFSCEFTATDENDLKVLVMCTGGATNAFTVNFIIDNKPPFDLTPKASASGYEFSVCPAGNAEKITITAVKAEDGATLTIMVYNHGEVDENGFANLPSCTISGTTTSCTNTLLLQYEVKSTEETDSTSASTDSSSSSSSSSTE
jgi:hypothetical protein